MASIEDILVIAEDIRQYVIDLPTRLLVSAGQIVIYSGLSDISESLGMIQAGEFRAGNRNDPGTFLKTAVAGTGFTGMRMAYPALIYDLDGTDTEFHLVGINDDVLQFGVNAANGTLVAGAGAVVLSATGIAATAGTIAGWTINSDYLGSDGTPGIKILSTGTIETSDFVSGLLGKGWRISEAGNAEFNNAVIRGELRTTVLTYQEVQAISGTMGVFQSAGVILETTGVVPAAASSMNIKVKDPDYGHAALFAVNDVLWIKDGTNATWFTVTTVTDNTTYYTYACTVESGSTGNVYTAGQAIVNFGVSGEGYLLLEAVGTGAPYFSVRTTSATPWTGATNLEHVRMGNLNGNWGYVADTYGVAIGKYDTNLPNITVDPTNGLRIRSYNSAEPLLQLDTSGNALLKNKLKMSGDSSAISIGADPPTASNAGTGIWIDKTGLYSLDSGNSRTTIDATTGILYAGYDNISLGYDGIRITTSTAKSGVSLIWESSLATRPNVELYTLVDAGNTVPQFFITGYGDEDVCEFYITANSGLGHTGGLIITDRYSKTLGLWSTWNELYWLGAGVVPVYVSSSSIKFPGIDVTTYFPPGTKIRFTQTTVKYFYVLSSSFSTDTTITLNGGGTYTVADASLGTFYYSHAAVADTMPFGSSTFIPLTTALTSTSWDGDSFSTTAKTVIDLSAVFSAPAGIKAVSLRVLARDSASAASSTTEIILSPNDTAASGLSCRCAGNPNDVYEDTPMTVPCDANGDIYYQVVASGAGTLDAIIQIHGYWI